MIMWHRELDLNFSLLETDSRRVCAMTCTIDQVKILFINVYLPYEDSNSEDDFCLQLSVMEDLIERYSDCLVICGGDFNVDFSSEWRHSTLLNDFCSKMSLHPAFRHGCNAVDYTYNFNMQRFSTIDHFLLCGFLLDVSLCKLVVSHDVDNRSDHDPVFMHLAIDNARIVTGSQLFTPKLNCLV